jgi:hypothetical protein
METHDFGLQFLDYLAKGLVERRSVTTGYRGCRIDGELLVVGLQPLTPAHLARIVWHWRRMAEEIDVHRRLGHCAVFTQLFTQLFGRKHRTGNSAQAATVRYSDREREIHRACHWTEEDRVLNFEELDEPAIGPHVASFLVIQSGPHSRRSLRPVCYSIVTVWSE